LYEAFLEGLLLFLVLYYFVKYGALKKPGLILGTFVFGYGLSRYFVEFFRVPDPQFFSSENLYGFAFSIGDVGLTMGQTLSLPMIIFGLILIVILSLKKRDS
jgi:phosphatidylglycerol:prolipoprotein diacylglycerol transferase